MRIVVNFINDAVQQLEKHGVQKTTLRRHDEPYKWRDDHYDQIAHMMFEVISRASSVTTAEFTGWSIQYSMVWSQFFRSDQSKTRKIILFKLRRLLYEEIRELNTLPNFQNGPILGFCLNVMGLKVESRRDYQRQEYPLRKAVISWAQHNYLGLVRKQRYVAEACLLGTITFDKKNKRLVKTYNRGLSLRPPKVYLKLQ